MKRILYVQANNKEVGGSDYCLLKMAREVSRRGYEVRVVLRSPTYLLDLYRQAGVEVQIAPILRFRKTRSPLRLAGYFFQTIASAAWLYRFIRRERIDLVHSNELLDWYANLAARLAGVPSCQHVRWIIPPGLVQGGMVAASLRFSDRIVCVSQAVQEQMYPHQTPPRVRVMYDWLDLQAAGHTGGDSSLRAELGLAESVPLVTCVGRVEPWKGQHVFLQAAGQVAALRADVHFLVVGAPTTDKEDYLAELQAGVRAAAWGERVHFLGQRTDMARIMGQSTVVAHTSITPEPFGLVVMEAMSCGTVVVGANAGGVVEQIVPGENGYLYPPGDACALAGCVLQVLDDPRRAEMGQRARAYVTAKFEKEKNIACLLKIYQELLH